MYSLLPTSTKEEAIAAIYADCLRQRHANAASVAEAVRQKGTLGLYWCTFYFVPNGILTDEEDWTAFQEGERRAISAVLGYEVELKLDGPLGNGHGTWLVQKMGESSIAAGQP